MKTSLAYIGHAVDDLLKRELKNPTPHHFHVQDAKAPRKIAGFHITDTAYAGSRLEEAKIKRKQVVSRYLELREELVDEFRTIGVKPRAIIPTAVFTKLCQDTGMYFVPKSNKTQVNVTHFLLWMQAKDPAVVMQETLESLNEFRPTRRVKIKKRDENISIEKYLAGHDHETIIRHLLDAPSSKDNEMSGVRSAMEVRLYASPTDSQNYELQLPEPPAEVIERLIRVADGGMTPQTVAVYGALSFVGGVEPILRQAARDLADHEQREEERINWMLHDPIVYQTRGPVTAIIDQFGPFPIEQQLVDRIEAAEFLPVNLD